MIRARKPIVLVVGAFLLVAGILTTCTRDEEGGATRTTLRVGWSSEPDKMNPITSYSTEALEVLQLVYDKLIQYDTNLQDEPGLAESWTYSEDGLDITYNLRSGVVWHDGVPFSADVRTIDDAGTGSEFSRWLVV
jgi:peptide/nickel transport system substrate-binding protein